jgi:hypothetical protein
MPNRLGGIHNLAFARSNLARVSRRLTPEFRQQATFVMSLKERTLTDMKAR